MENNRGETQTGFTLIELLVVIAIIALLLTIILPALNRSKDAARQVVCAAQMKQWALAAQAYAAENSSEIPPYADTRDMTNSGNALDIDTYWYNRLSHYLTGEGYGTWGMQHAVRQCPSSKAAWGETAVWVGVYYGYHDTRNAPFVFFNKWDGSKITRMANPFKCTTIKIPADYLMMLDVQRDRVHDFFKWPWNADYDQDGSIDSNTGLVTANSAPYNWAQPKVHRDGCNIALFDGHVEYIKYNTFWEFEADGYPAHRFWYNQNRP